MPTLSDAESSARWRVAPSRDAEVLLLEAMLQRLRQERSYLMPEHLEARIRTDLAISRVERDLHTARRRRWTDDEETWT